MGIIKNLFKKLFRRRKKELTPEQLETIRTKDFFDRALPSTVKCYTDHYICGNYYKSIWAITEYPPNTEETALLAHLADRSGVTLRIHNRLVTAMEQKKIMQQAMRKNTMMSTTNDINETVKAEENMNDIVNLLAELKRDRETLLHTAVFIELKADTEEKLRELQADIQMELTRSKISVDKLLLRQKEGFTSDVISSVRTFLLTLTSVPMTRPTVISLFSATADRARAT